ncbi:DUF2326 domain-containing protein [Azospirillum brasilense]|uniref:DUF2326 domain-containing protein n=1 Tax=Azospirillum argentinense TaxID=2970906 RepID=UPI00190EC2C0|nr:DUF2326 domain-containing protein [Azospirillum argentinense]MBK3801303.1 DUF2326 domain-containing protein [Azospirillum argentinense]
MQIGRIYSNKPDIFFPIDFNCGDNADVINIIIGEVRRPQDKKRDSHNLGKTTLLHLIDFLMLKGLSQEHFLSKHQELFVDFVFYLEIALNSGDYATVRRGVSDPNLISLARHGEPNQDFTDTPNDGWTHSDLPIVEAVTLLDAWLDLRVLKPYDYRKAITYFLRSQQDWSDELQLQKFQLGRDLYWKPFVAHLFGFKGGVVQRKYELDDTIQKLKQKQADLQAEVQFKEDDLPELAAKLSVLHQQVDELERQLDSFQFDAQERRIVQELVESVEQEVAELNETIYNIRYDIKQIDNSLGHKDKFDLKEVEAIFKEAQLYFPDQIKKQYEDLVGFKKKVTRERDAALRARRKQLSEQMRAAEERKATLDASREEQLRILRNTDTIDKFKTLQKDLTKQRAQLVYLEGQRSRLDSVADAARQVREAERERGRVVDEIKAMVLKPTPIYEKFTRIFNDYCQQVLSREGIFYFHVNNSNNLQYEISLGLTGQKGKSSSQGDGTSYKKLVCALFDLALLKVYEDMPFFHFVYHDGMFESLDDRKKLAFLDVVRKQVADKKTQYIMTVIASDLPRTDKGQVIDFSEKEVVLRLHDDGPEGRLFRMGEF